MSLTEISSSSNPRFRQWLELVTSSKARAAQQHALIEGEHLARAWLDAGQGPVAEVVLPRRSGARRDLQGLCSQLSSSLCIVEDRLFDRLSQVEHGTGPLFVVPIRKLSHSGAIDEDAVFLDGVQDPGNVGTILRTAAAFGIRRVLTSPQTADVWSPKVIRAAMGAHFVLTIDRDVDSQSLIAQAGLARITAADPKAAMRIDQVDLRVARIWAFGSEGGGVSAPLSEAQTVVRLRIAHDSAMESLNVAVAAAICLHEQYRQRHSVSASAGALRSP